MDLAVRDYSLCGVVWYRTLTVNNWYSGDYSLCGVVWYRTLRVN